MIKEKENPEDESERKRKRDPFSFELPKRNEPGASVRGLKRCAYGKRLRARSVETIPICHSGGCDKGKRHAVVSTEPSHMPVEQRRVRKSLEEKRGDKHEEGKNDRDVCTRWCES